MFWNNIGDLLDSLDDTATVKLQGIKSPSAVLKLTSEAHLPQVLPQGSEAHTSRKSERLDSRKIIGPSSPQRAEVSIEGLVALPGTSDSSAPRLAPVSSRLPPLSSPCSQSSSSSQNTSLNPATVSDELSVLKNSASVIEGECGGDDIMYLRNALAKLKSENEGLRNVWNETRAQTEKLKELLRSKNQSHQNAIRDKDASIRVRLEEAHSDAMQKDRERQASHEAELQTLSRALDLARKELNEMANRHSEALAANSMELGQVQERSHNLQVQCEQLRVRVMDLVDARSRLMEANEQEHEAHAHMLMALRKEQESRELAIISQREMHAKTLAQLQTRESALEDHQAEHVQALAIAHRALEDKSRECSRAEAALRWLQADRAVLEEKLAASSERLAQETQALARAQMEQRSKSDLSVTRIAELCARVQIAEAEARESARRVQVMQEATLVSSSPSSSETRVIELENQLSEVMERLEGKQAALETLSLERSALRLQLEHEISRIGMLETNLAELSTRSDASVAISAGYVDLETGLRTRSANWRTGSGDASVAGKSKQAVRSALGILDVLGLQLAHVLRKYPQARLGFAAYLLLSHVWILFVLFAFLTSSVSLETGGIGPVELMTTSMLIDNIHNK